MIATDLLRCLWKSGLLDPALAEADLTLEDASRRNENIKVLNRSGRSYFVKHAVDSDNSRHLQHEAATYALLSTDGLWPTYDCLPHSYGYDSTIHALVLELIPDAEDLLAYHERLGRFPKGVASSLGRALGELHGLDLTLEARARQADAPPAVLSLHKPLLESLRTTSAANLDLLKVLQAHAELGRLFDELREAWQPRTLIHCDLRWENCLVTGGRRRTIKLVDWELSGLGDAGWDIACVLANYLRFWVLSMPYAPELPPEVLAQEARYPLAKMQPSIEAFWTAYASTRALDPTEATDLLLCSVRFMAARLVETAYGRLLTAARITAEARLLLQLALNTLRRPHEAAVHLLGIPLVQKIEA